MAGWIADMSSYCIVTGVFVEVLWVAGTWLNNIGPPAQSLLVLFLLFPAERGAAYH